MRSLIIATWLGTNLGNALLLSVMGVEAHFRRWPSLFAFLWIVTLQACFDTGIVMSNLSQTAFAFNGHYAFALILDLIEVWMTVEIAWALVGPHPKLRKWLGTLVPAYAVTALVGACLLSLSRPSSYRGDIVSFSYDFDLAVSLAWLVTFLSIALAAGHLNVQWTGSVQWVAAGFLMEVLSSNVGSFLLQFGVKSPVITLLKAMSYLATLMLWSYSLLNAGSVWSKRLERHEADSALSM